MIKKAMNYNPTYLPQTNDMFTNTTFSKNAAALLTAAGNFLFRMRNWLLVAEYLVNLQYLKLTLEGHSGSRYCSGTLE